MTKKILVPVDGSENSDKALRFAIFLALEGDDKEIILINVQPSYNTRNIRNYISQEQIRAFQEESSKTVFDHCLDILQGCPFQLRTVAKTGDPGREICAEAKESSVDFIVMGYRGLGVVKRAILGSVATHVLHETTCPVMIVP